MGYRARRRADQGKSGFGAGGKKKGIAKKKLSEKPVDKPVPAMPAIVAARKVVPTIAVDTTASGEYAVMEAPAGWRYDRHIVINGVTLEHDSTTAYGVWRYRRM